MPPPPTDTHSLGSQGAGAASHPLPEHQETATRSLDSSSVPCALGGDLAHTSTPKSVSPVCPGHCSPARIFPSRVKEVQTEVDWLEAGRPIWSPGCWSPEGKDDQGEEIKAGEGGWVGFTLQSVEMAKG